MIICLCISAIIAKGRFPERLATVLHNFPNSYGNLSDELHYSEFVRFNYTLGENGLVEETDCLLVSTTKNHELHSRRESLIDKLENN